MTGYTATMNTIAGSFVEVLPNLNKKGLRFIRLSCRTRTTDGYLTLKFSLTGNERNVFSPDWYSPSHIVLDNLALYVQTPISATVEIEYWI